MTLTDGLSFWGSGSIDSTDKKILDVTGSQNCLVTNILQNILFYVPPKKEIHTGLEWHEAE